MAAVVINITSLGRVAQTRPGFDGPPLGARLATENNRQFDEDLLFQATVTHGYARLRTVTHGYAWLHTVTHGYAGCVQLCTVTDDQVWLKELPFQAAHSVTYACVW